MCWMFSWATTQKYLLRLDMFFLFGPFYYFSDPPSSPILTNLPCGSSHFTSSLFRAALDCLPESNFPRIRVSLRVSPRFHNGCICRIHHEYCFCSGYGYHWTGCNMDRLVADTLPSKSSKYVLKSSPFAQMRNSIPPLAFTPVLTIYSSLDPDPERNRTQREAIVCRVESVELASLIRPSTNCSNINENTRFEIEDNSRATIDMRLSISGTSETTLADIVQKPASGNRDNDRTINGGSSVLRNATSSCCSTRDNNSSIAGANDGYYATNGPSVLSGTTFPMDDTDDVLVKETSVGSKEEGRLAIGNKQ